MPVFVPASFPDNQRRSGRVRIMDVRSSLGYVMDLSATGMRVKCTAPVPLKEGMEIPITLVAPTGPVLVRVKVMWVKKKMLGAREAGFHFTHLTPSLQATLGELSREAVYNGRVGEEEEPPLAKSA